MMAQDSDREENKAFQDAMRHVKPLKATNHPQETLIPPRKLKIPKTIQSIPIPPSTDFLILSDPSADTSRHTPSSTLFYTRHSLRTQQLRALKRGTLKISTRLDLHGLTLEKARDALTNFMETKQHQGTRSVLIIHGKGYRSSQGPVLKHSLDHWLRQFPNVLAFCSAQPKEGGTGAVYVLVKN